MKETIQEAISSGLHGKWTHIDPKKAISGLAPSIARKRPSDKTHSCWEFLHHIVVWQDAIIRQIKGETIDWNELEKKHNWPTEDLMQDDSNFENLVDKFLAGLEEAKELLMNVNLTKTMLLVDGFPEISIIKLYLILLQHKSYHLGQIMSVRNQLGESPP